MREAQGLCTTWPVAALRCAQRAIRYLARARAGTPQQRARCRWRPAPWCSSERPGRPPASGTGRRAGGRGARRRREPLAALATVPRAELRDTLTPKTQGGELDDGHREVLPRQPEDAADGVDGQRRAQRRQRRPDLVRWASPSCLPCDTGTHTYTHTHTHTHAHTRAHTHTLSLSLTHNTIARSVRAHPLHSRTHPTPQAGRRACRASS
jgi:hypothetical protein